MRPCWLGKIQTMREARLSVGGGDERGEMAGPRGDSAEDGPGGSGRLPYYAVPKDCADLASVRAEGQN